MRPMRLYCLVTDSQAFTSHFGTNALNGLARKVSPPHPQKKALQPTPHQTFPPLLKLLPASSPFSPLLSTYSILSLTPTLLKPPPPQFFSLHSQKFLCAKSIKMADDEQVSVSQAHFRSSALSLSFFFSATFAGTHRL